MKKLCVDCNTKGVTGKKRLCAGCLKEHQKRSWSESSKKYRNRLLVGDKTLNHRLMYNGELTEWARKNPKAALKQVKAQPHSKALPLLEKLLKKSNKKPAAKKAA